MPLEASSYYPPRAGKGRLPSGIGTWGTRVFHRFGHWGRRLPEVHLPLMCGADWLWSLGVPGYAYSALGRRKLGLWMAMTWMIAALVLLLFRGHPVATAWALGALASTHTSGLAFALLRVRELDSDAPPVTLATRVGLPLVLWIVAATGVYWPLDGLLTRWFARGIEVDGRRIVVNPRVSADQVTRGQVVLYRMAGQVYGTGTGAIGFQGGWGFGEVLGMPGDTVEFRRERFGVHQRWSARRPHMPIAGEVPVLPGHWWIWPRVRMLQVPPDAGRISHALLDQAMVSQAQFAGRPYRRWFFWRQDLP